MTAKLHDDILDALPYDFRRRMVNWSSSLGGGWVATSSFRERVDGSLFADDPPVIMLGEAADTHKAVRALPPYECDVVTVFWGYLARDLWWMCRATPTLRNRATRPDEFRATLGAVHGKLVAQFKSGRVDRMRAVQV